MSLLFLEYATKKDPTGAVYMTMEDFVEACERQESDNASAGSLGRPPVANTYLLRRADMQEVMSE
jgi:hypothetical protein